MARRLTCNSPLPLAQTCVFNRLPSILLGDLMGFSKLTHKKEALLSLPLSLPASQEMVPPSKLLPKLEPGCHPLFFSPPSHHISVPPSSPLSISCRVLCDPGPAVFPFWCPAHWPAFLPCPLSRSFSPQDICTCCVGSLASLAPIQALSPHRAPPQPPV